MSEDHGVTDPDKLEIPRIQSRVRWSGFLILGASLLLVVYVANHFGKTAAEVSAVALLSIGLFAAVVQRHRFWSGAGDHGDGGGAVLAGDCGDGGGGGDC